MMIELEIHAVKVSEYDYKAYCEGALAQDAFPYLDATEREQIISLICPQCQESIFGTEEEDEDFDDCDFEMGFNPYIGCFDFDCQGCCP